MKDQKELFQVMSEQLKNAGCVKDSFLEGITNREQEFPTGLEVNQIGFAIPHTDSAHVNSSQICFASLKEPLVFSDMTDKSHEIPVRLVFMLAMSQPHEQIDTLQNLVSLFQNEEKVNELLACTTKEAFIELVHSAGVY
ncbi:PTS sugar transporter subunit IIA [Enterococcus faecium]|uniref:PTS sugar transporter subunit IIA n=1 Tax=Enterococcus faecium TaxID=1352 RepID=UPI001B01DA2D|nr:PTS sugar transporter subunit IIA [Enterococcus faecium]BDP99045.1 PTS fructose transporter subunit IIA [Enterococcus faecium]HAQ1308722.1 PTS sugar transporter subunit IIA [Enterococcus faecium]HAZ9323851.1 PTS sugar transporter subunit IIA [Enterococcus faecium]HCC1641945.1 PTS sugar transporter subunit IIA [Enterococcus faecium]HCR4723905.1 PTS sugar transporter subunit IIA [Enterococcus faecium]